MLIVEHLSKRFGDLLAVDDVSFSVQPGDIYAMIGPNSSGKTTIIRSIVGLLAPDEGKISIGGMDVIESPKDTKGSIGYIPDEPSVWSGMTGEEFLHFSGALYGVPPAERSRRIETLLPEFGLSEIRKGYFEDYSRGNKQKFSILAALLHEPKLLLVDEPIVGLDPESAIVAKRLFSTFASRGGAVVLVTHTLPVAEEIATRIGVMRKGRLLAEGDMRELVERSGAKPSSSLSDVYSALTRDA